MPPCFPNLSLNLAGKASGLLRMEYSIYNASVVNWLCIEVGTLLTNYMCTLLLGNLLLLFVTIYS